jgi:hypothetical protein
MYQRWMLVFFCAFALMSVKPKKERESVKEKVIEKSKSANVKKSVKENKRKFAQSYSAGGKTRILSKMYSIVC